MASAKWKWNVNPGNVTKPSASFGCLVWGFTFNARYFRMFSLAFTASFGYGIGFLNIGLNLKL